MTISHQEAEEIIDLAKKEKANTDVLYFNYFLTCYTKGLLLYIHITPTAINLFFLYLGDVTGMKASISKMKQDDRLDYAIAAHCTSAITSNYVDPSSPRVIPRLREALMRKHNAANEIVSQFWELFKGDVNAYEFYKEVLLLALIQRNLDALLVTLQALLDNRIVSFLFYFYLYWA